MLTPNEINQRFVESYYMLYGLRLVRNKTEFCHTCGVFPSNFKLMETGDRHVTLTHLCNCVNFYPINPSWLFAGKGEKLTGRG